VLGTMFFYLILIRVGACIKWKRVARKGKAREDLKWRVGLNPTYLFWSMHGKGWICGNMHRSTSWMLGPIECLTHLIVFGAERDVVKEEGKCFLNHLLGHTMVR
jgi:hypothetical protein